VLANPLRSQPGLTQEAQRVRRYRPPDGTRTRRRPGTMDRGLVGWSQRRPSWASCVSPTAMRDMPHAASSKLEVARVQRSGTRDLQSLTGRSRVPRCALRPGYTSGPDMHFRSHLHDEYRLRSECVASDGYLRAAI